MSMPRRQYIVARTRARRTCYFYGGQLRDAIKLAKFRAGEKFSYGVMERGNMVECVVTSIDAKGGLRYQERG